MVLDGEGPSKCAYARAKREKMRILQRAMRCEKSGRFMSVPRLARYRRFICALNDGIDNAREARTLAREEEIESRRCSW